jgi:hypothetical protein
MLEKDIFVLEKLLIIIFCFTKNASMFLSWKIQKALPSSTFIRHN